MPSSVIRVLCLIPEKVEEIASYVLEHGNVAFGIATIENAYDETSIIEVLRKDEIMEREPHLLEIARSKMAHLMVDHLDVLVVDEIGKDISGTGLDTNIIKSTRICLQRILYRGLLYWDLLKPWAMVME